MVATKPPPDIEDTQTEKASRVLIANIQTDGDTQFRETLDEAYIAQLAESISELPLIIVYKDKDGVMWLANGFHRLAAYVRAGREYVSDIVRKGRLEEAVLHAAGANAKHGLRRDRYAIFNLVSRLLSDPN